MSGYAFHPDAFADLVEIWEYIAQDNVDAADRVLEDIHTVLRTLATSSHIGHRRPDLTARPLRFHVARNEYLIAYAPDEKPHLGRGGSPWAAKSAAAGRDPSRPELVRWKIRYSRPTTTAVAVRRPIRIIKHVLDGLPSATTSVDSGDYFSRTIAKEPRRAVGCTTHPAFSVTLQPSPRRLVPSRGPETGTDSVDPSAARKTPPFALRRPH